jgi:Mn2+/Fe2+ NRAMP family transporter
LARRPAEAKAFYAGIVIATLLGVSVSFSPVDPMRVLFWSAVINGLVAVPVTMMLISSSQSIMKQFAVVGFWSVMDRIATAVMLGLPSACWLLPSFKHRLGRIAAGAA